MHFHADQSYRSWFPDVGKSIRLNTNVQAACSSSSKLHIKQVAQEWGSQEWYSTWNRELERVRLSFAQMIGAHPQEIFLTPNVPVAFAALQKLLQEQSPYHVVTCDLDIPSVSFPWYDFHEKGFECSVIPSVEHSKVPLEYFEAAFREKKIDLIVTSQVFPTSGQMQDVTALATLAHRHDAALFLDACYSAGYCPIDVHAQGIDILIADSHRWLFGAPGLTLLYIREGLFPTLSASVARMLGLCMKRPQDTSSFELGMHLTALAPAPTTLAVTAGGMEMLQTIGMTEIWERTSALTALLKRQLHDTGWHVLGGEKPVSSALVALRTPQSEHLAKALAKHSILVSSQPGILWLALAFYLTPEEIEYTVSVLNRAAHRTSQ
jgi:selenocysteine lyase/cysteine desulfurase